MRGRDGHLVRPLTAPTFDLRAFVDLDEPAGHLWVVGGDDPTQLHLLRVPLDPRPGGPEQVTREPGRHGAIFAKHHRCSVRSFSGLEGTPVQEVVGADGERLGVLKSVAEAPGITPRLTFDTVGSRGYHTVILHPANFHSGERYPVIVSVYGGPHSQQVTRVARDYLLRQWLADQGFIVISIDGRGTPGRGRAWERSIKGNLIETPLADQIEALHALAATHPEMDLSRVGIYGWSFGGYF